MLCIFKSCCPELFVQYYLLILKWYICGLIRKQILKISDEKCKCFVNLIFFYFQQEFSKSTFKAHVNDYAYLFPYQKHVNILHVTEDLITNSKLFGKQFCCLTIHIPISPHQHTHTYNILLFSDTLPKSTLIVIFRVFFNIV